MSNKTKKVDIQGISVTLNTKGVAEYICITDIAKYKNPDASRDIIKNWMRNKNTIELLGLWERLNNVNFKQVEFDLLKNEVAYNMLQRSKIFVTNNYKQNISSIGAIQNL